MATGTRTRANGKHQEQAAALDQKTPAGGSLAFRVMPLDCFVRTALFTLPFGKEISFEGSGNAIMAQNGSHHYHLLTLSPGLECRYFRFDLMHGAEVTGWFVGTPDALDELQAFEDRVDETQETVKQIHQSVEAFIYGGADPFAVEAV
jgi:hypothetical protein